MSRVAGRTPAPAGTVQAHGGRAPIGVQFRDLIGDSGRRAWADPPSVQVPERVTEEGPTVDLADVEITSSDEFRAVLAEAVEKADHAGVDVRGAWEFETRGSTHDWEAEIHELVRDRENE